MFFYIDLSKAFDTIDHHVLLNRLYRDYVIVEQALAWISSYLTARRHFVQFGTACSQLEPITCGVPQGAIVGPLLFITYVNDLPNALNLLKILLLANDSSLFYSHVHPNQAISVTNFEIMKVMD